jgi:hypothetical protein
MNPDPLDDLLKAYSAQPLPPPAPQSKATIWREIEKRRRRAWSGIFVVLSWRELFAEPRLAIAGLAVALITGMVPAAAAHAFESPRVVRESLHLEVFTTCSSCIPVGLTAEHRRR